MPRLTATANNIIGEIEPPETMYGILHLPETRETYTRTTGEMCWMKVVAVGPEVEHVQPGMVVAIDPNKIETEDLAWKHEGKQYATVPEIWFDWKNDFGYLFGIEREE